MNLDKPNSYFDGMSRANLGIWRSYKAMSDSEKQQFAQFMKNDDITFDYIANLNYNASRMARQKISSIKQQREFNKMRDEAYLQEQDEMQRILDNVESEYMRLGFDPEYMHHGLNQ